MFSLVFGVLLSYLSGSICSAVVISKLFSLPDPRVEGSQNPGATNVLRLAGKKYAAFVLIADMLKGFLPILLFKILGAAPVLLGIFCLATVLGHMYPVFFGFKGGKGVATFLGAIIGFHFTLGLFICLVWLAIAKFTRLSSLAALVVVTITPFLSLFAFHNLRAFIPLLATGGLIIYRHKANISRLFEGTEPKIGENQIFED